jgi:hypothetical protein
MGSLLLAGAIVLALFVLLALFARGGPTESVSAPGLSPEHEGLARLTLAELGNVTSRLFDELGLRTVSLSEQPNRVDLTLEDPTPVTGQRAYARCVLVPELGAVQSAEVQAALDTARGQSLSKAIVVTPGPFSDEARVLARQSPLELIDGAKLAALLRAHLPDVANRLGLPR